MFTAEHLKYYQMRIKEMNNLIESLNTGVSCLFEFLFFSNEQEQLIEEPKFHMGNHV
jgi:hypothetical protein